MNAITIIASLSVPVIVLIVGLIAKARPARNINGVIGYRSKTSRSSQEMWDKAQMLMAKYLIIIGVMLLVVSAIAVFVMSNAVSGNSALIGVCILNTVQVAAIVMMIPLVESGLKK